MGTDGMDTTDLITYGSVCSGIESATVAWSSLGWRAAFFAEIDAFPCAVLAHHYPAVPNFGDLNRFSEWPDATIDVLVGGTPCQSFSVAGLRAGLADPRGNLALTYLAVVARYRPRWLVWENVPGVLSSHEGRDFAAFLSGLGQLGYGWAYRVLDAQYFRVPQRRRRVFVVGCARGWAGAAAVLFERESLSGHPAPSREARENIARPIGAGSPGGSGYRNDADTAENLIANGVTARYRKGTDSDATDTLLVSHSLRADGFDASEDGTGRGTPLVPVAAPLSAGNNANSNAAGRRREDDINLVAFDTTQITHPENRSRPDDRSPQLAATAHPPAIAFHARQDPDSGLVTHPLDTDGSSIAIAFQSSQSGERLSESLPTLDGNYGPRRRSGVLSEAAVRRLTPRECERLHGFPDDYTL